MVISAESVANDCQQKSQIMERLTKIVFLNALVIHINIKKTAVVCL